MAENTYDNNDQGRQDQAQSIVRTASPPLTTTPNQQPVGQTQGQTNQEMSDAEALKQVSPTVTMGQVAATQHQYVNNLGHPEKNQVGNIIQNTLFPPGEDVDANIEVAKDMSLLDFVNHVRSSGEWDYKRYARRVKPNPYEGAGNFNFGATGRALGLPETILKMGAGAYQIHENNSLPSWGGPPWSGVNRKYKKRVDDAIFNLFMGMGLNGLNTYLATKYAGVVTNRNHGDQPIDQIKIGEGCQYYDQQEKCREHESSK